MKGLNFGDPLDWNEIFGPTKFMENPPTCPLGGTYTMSKTIPATGALAIECDHADHVPPNHSDW
jgi:hypothetical protein